MGFKVAVLMGGSSFEREFSLASGKMVCQALEERGHKVLALDTTPQLVDILRSERPDVAYIALHGGAGEDGTIQSLLEYLDIPFVGSPSEVCRLTWNKSMLPFVLGTVDDPGSFDGPSWPTGVCLASAAFKDMGAACALDLVEERIPAGYPLCVKPASGGSAMGISKVEEKDQLATAILDALSFDSEVLIEEWVDGVEMGVSLFETSEGPIVLPPVEICPKERYDTNARLDAAAVDYYAPVRAESLSPDPELAASIRSEVERVAMDAFQAFGCRDLGRVDLIWDGAQAKILEVDISPGMTPLSLFPTACKAMGLELGDVLETLLERAVER